MEGKALALRVFISSTDKWGHELLSEKLVMEAYNKGLAGATVFKGTMGYGASSVIHSSRFWELGEKVPVIVEIIDHPDKIENFLDTIKPILEEMKNGCMIATQEVNVLIYKSGKKH